MLEVLRIQNYALIDDVEVELTPGFNVLTGETGAGKSIVVEALNLVLGGRASSETVREGVKRAKIDAVFRIPKPPRRLSAILRDNDILVEDGELLLSRVVTAEGRSRAYVCGSVVPVSVLAAVGDELVDIHGQHEHQSLLKADRQLDLVDFFAGTEALAGEVGELVGRLRALDRAAAELESEDRERARRVEFMKHEVGEIDAANLEPGEEEEVKARRNLITNAEQIFTLASHARTVLYEGEDSTAVAALDAAMADLEELAAIDERFRPLAEQLKTARVAVEEAAEEVRQLSDGLDFDGDELERLNERLAVIGDLKRKFGASIEAVLEYRARAAAEVEAYAQRDQRLAEIQAQRQVAADQARKCAAALSQKRKAAAKKLDKLVTTALQDLGMKGGAFSTSLTETELSATGLDQIEFLLSANPGEKLKPLRQVASGGEISRIMLALKSVFAEADKIPTLIFDEIDAGVGGHIARKVAEKIRRLARSHQTVCVTHIAQIAALADSHYHVVKTTQKNRTATRVVRMEKKERIEELARLLDGSLSPVSVKHAQALLAET